MSDLAHQVLPLWRSLFRPNERILVGTSGGPDSQTLLDLLARLRDALGLGNLWAAGINHGLRAAADSELDHAEALAKQHGITFYRLPVYVPTGGNVLANARDARYAALRNLAHELGGATLAVAHTATDQAETILLNLVRGSGLAGAAGMRMRRQDLLRPLLTIERDQILAHVQARALPYALDPSNIDVSRARAFLRSNVLPALAGLNPRYAQNIGRFAALAGADHRLLNRRARKLLATAWGPCGALQLSPLAQVHQVVGTRVLRLWLAHHGVTHLGARHLQTLWDARGATRFAYALQGKLLSIEREHLWCGLAPGYDTLISVPGKTTVGSLNTTLVTALMRVPERFAVSNVAAGTSQGVAFDADRLHFGLRLRSWRQGDKLRPFGLNGHVKVGDLFTNAKIPRPLRSGWPVVTDGERILWVVGLKRSEHAPVTDETQCIITLQLDGALPWSAC